MARPTKRLFATQLMGLPPGLHADGEGLYLRVDDTGNRRWVFIYYRHGKRREMGLGRVDPKNLAQTRKLAAKARMALDEGLDPIDERRRANAPPVDQTFSAVAEDLLDDLAKGWRSPKQRPLWEASLQQHAPAIWRADVARVDTEMVLSALRPIWTDKRETATRIRSRIERVLDAAKARGLREGENPARWRGHLDALLSRSRQVKGHHAAMPYQDVPAFLTRLAQSDSISAQAMRFLILTAARSGEVRGATWEEINRDVWTIPAARMKAGKEHRVPLPRSAIAILNGIDRPLRSGLIFPGLNGPMSDMTLAQVLRKRKIADATPHGFRSSFRDWAGDCTSFPRELIEEALAHQVGNAVERAYRRSDALAKRRKLMDAWGAYCDGETNVRALHA